MFNYRFIVLLLIIITIVIIFVFPNIIESLLRKNHYNSKNSLVKTYIIPNLPSVKNNNLKILDFGSGSGALTDSIKKNVKTSSVTPLDIEDVHEYGDKPLIYDGKTIPMNHNIYDTVICLFVLHHIPEQDKILNEIIRVSNKRLLIMEDCTDTFIDKILTSIHAFSSYGKCHNCFHSTEEWKKIFESKGLNVTKVIDLPRSMLPIYPVCRKLFVLDK